MNQNINTTLAALIPVLRMNGENVVSIEAVHDWYKGQYKDANGRPREYMKEVAEITYESGGVKYADIGGDSNLTACYDVIAVIQQRKPQSAVIERIERGVYPAAQPETHEERTETHACDCIDRQAAIDAADEIIARDESGNNDVVKAMTAWKEYIKELPSAQPEQRCVNCGRNANNGGWYADGGTRCPIEEHYALPKDGFCHLWEERNITDDDYPERREK